MPWSRGFSDQVPGSRSGLDVDQHDTEIVDVCVGWTTEGWWNVAPQTCETLYKGALSSRFYYIHAIDYDRGGEWAGQSFMCTTERAFTIKGVQDCGKRGYKRTGFFEVDTQDAHDWTIRLTDPGGGKGCDLLMPDVNPINRLSFA